MATVAIPIQTIRVYLGYYRFPTTPMRIQLADASTVLSYDIIARGTIAMPRGYAPTRCTLEGTFYGETRSRIPGLAEPWLEPFALCRDLALWTRESDVQGPRRLAITGIGVSFDAYPESFSWQPVGGFGDAQYQLSLYEERHLSADGRSWARAPGTSSGTWQYKTVTGDTLATVAGQQLGDSTRWPEIRELNQGVRAVLDEEIPAGTVLQMPATGSPGTVGEI